MATGGTCLVPLLSTCPRLCCRFAASQASRLHGREGSGRVQVAGATAAGIRTSGAFCVCDEQGSDACWGARTAGDDLDVAAKPDEKKEQPLKRILTKFAREEPRHVGLGQAEQPPGLGLGDVATAEDGIDAGHQPGLDFEAVGIRKIEVDEDVVAAALDGSALLDPARFTGFGMMSSLPAYGSSAMKAQAFTVRDRACSSDAPKVIERMERLAADALVSPEDRNTLEDALARIWEAPGADGPDARVPGTGRN